MLVFPISACIRVIVPSQNPGTPALFAGGLSCGMVHFCPSAPCARQSKRPNVAQAHTTVPGSHEYIGAISTWCHLYIDAMQAGAFKLMQCSDVMQDKFLYLSNWGWPHTFPAKACQGALHNCQCAWAEQHLYTIQHVLCNNVQFLFIMLLVLSEAWNCLFFCKKYCTGAA